MYVYNSGLNTFLGNFKRTGPFWIGLNDKNAEGKFEWANGETLSYGSKLKSHPWGPWEPNVIIKL